MSYVCYGYIQHYIYSRLGIVLHSVDNFYCIDLLAKVFIFALMPSENTNFFTKADRSCLTSAI